MQNIKNYCAKGYDMDCHGIQSAPRDFLVIQSLLLVASIYISRVMIDIGCQANYMDIERCT